MQPLSNPIWFFGGIGIEKLILKFILCHPVHCRVFRSISGLHLLDANSHQSLGTTGLGSQIFGRSPELGNIKCQGNTGDTTASATVYSCRSQTHACATLIHARLPLVRM